MFDTLSIRLRRVLARLGLIVTPPEQQAEPQQPSATTPPVQTLPAESPSPSLSPTGVEPPPLVPTPELTSTPLELGDVRPFATPARRITVTGDEPPNYVVAQVLDMSETEAAKLLRQIHIEVGRYTKYTASQFARFILAHYHEDNFTKHSTPRQIALAFERHRDEQIAIISKRYRTMEEIQREDGDWRSD